MTGVLDAERCPECDNIVLPDGAGHSRMCSKWVCGHWFHKSTGSGFCPECGKANKTY